MNLGDAATLRPEPSSDPGRVDFQRRSGAAFFADAVSPRNPTHRLLSGVAPRLAARPCRLAQREAHLLIPEIAG
jgi:hypothetical protein